MLVSYWAWEQSSPFLDTTEQTKSLEIEKEWHELTSLEKEHIEKDIQLALTQLDSSTLTQDPVPAENKSEDDFVAVEEFSDVSNLGVEAGFNHEDF